MLGLSLLTALCQIWLVVIDPMQQIQSQRQHGMIDLADAGKEARWGLGEAPRR